MESTRMTMGQGYIEGYAAIFPGSYVLIGIFAEPARIILVQNFTDVFLKFSISEDFEDNFFLPPNGFLLLDVGTNKGTPNTSAFHAGTVVYATTVDVTAPTTGYICTSYCYAG